MIILIYGPWSIEMLNIAYPLNVKIYAVKKLGEMHKRWANRYLSNC